MIKLLPRTLLAITILMMGKSAYGLITFTLDATTKTFDVSGSVTATPVSLGPTSYLRYSSPDSGNVQGSNFLNLTPETGSSPSGIFSTILVIRDYDVQDDAYIDFTYSGSGQFPQQTISLTAVDYDYTSLDPIYQSVFEGLASAGTTMTIEVGTSIDTIQIVAVPEPATYSAIIALLVLAMFAWRRQFSS